MSVIDEALVTLLESVSGITALVATRIYPVNFPQNVTKPAIRLNKISSTPDYALDGPTGHITDRFQIDVVGDTITSVSGVSEAIRNGIDAYRGTVLGIIICGIFFENESIERDDKSREYILRRDILIHHN